MKTSKRESTSLSFERKISNSTLWKLNHPITEFVPPPEPVSPYDRRNWFKYREFILMVPGHVCKGTNEEEQIIIFYLSDKDGTKYGYKGFALTRDLDRAKQEFEWQLGHRGPIEHKSKYHPEYFTLEAIKKREHEWGYSRIC